MKRIVLAAAGLMALAVPAALHASGDYSCDVVWKLASGGPDCADRIAIAPGNDSRVNLLLLLRSKAGLRTPEGAYTKVGYESEGYGHTFLDWDMLAEGIFPGTRLEEATYDPDAPVPPSEATLAFLAALDGAQGLPANEKQVLGDLRRALDSYATRLVNWQAARQQEEWWKEYNPGCGEIPATGAADELSTESACESSYTPKPAGPEPIRPNLDLPIGSSAGKAFLAYLKAADAFNAERWSDAGEGFVALSRSPEPWVKETSAYLVGRTLLRQALAETIGDDGCCEDLDKVDKARVEAGEAALQSYLRAYPTGRYAASARGLQRRALWLKGDQKGLAAAYEALLGREDAAKPEVTALVEEVDNKLLFYTGRDPAAQGALLLATLDLVQMRSYTEEDWDEATNKPVTRKIGARLTEADIAAQAQAFANEPALYGLIKANHAFYVKGDYRQVLALVPDDARGGSYNAVDFSRQVLRGQALAALKDPNTEGFWRELLGGANDMWQRPTVELGLAMAMERNGRVAQALGRDSVLRDTLTRQVLAARSAGPATLRDIALNEQRPQQERDSALFALLYKQLTRGDYAGFVANRALVRKGADTEAGLWDYFAAETIPVGLFTAGKWSDGYPCGPLGETAQKLAANPNDPAARLCVGEFLRLNGFDYFTALDAPAEADELGGARREFKGTATPRGMIYRDLVANRTTPANERAYALYRLVRCYAPSGNNSCGDPDVEEPQRAAWFQQLQREYPTSPWARKLKFYW